MTEDCFSKTAVKKWADLCDEHDFSCSRQEVLDRLKFYCFDVLVNGEENKPFDWRYTDAAKACNNFPELAIHLSHIKVNNAKEVESYFENVINQGYEGLILRNPQGKYKFGRCTVKENNAFKLKPWVTVDAQIIGFVQATKVNEDAEKTTNELGYSRTSKKIEDRHLIEKAQAFVVKYEDKEVSVPIAMTDEQKEYIWKHQSEYLGKWIEYKFMTVGMKKDGLPRIPKFIRMRSDKD